MTTRIAYGFEPNLPAFDGLSHEEVAHYLRDMGCDGVFMHGPDRAWSDAFHTAGLRFYTALGLFSGADLWDRFPESRPVMADGQPAPQEDWYKPAIPTLPELRAHRLKQIAELAQTLPLDGLWLDGVRWPARWENAKPFLYSSSFDPVTLRQFQTDTGIALPAEAPAPAKAAEWILAHEADAWFRWRCELIAAFVAEARTILKRHLPDALLGVFTVPWAGDDFDKAIIRIVGQDPTLLADHVDVFSPMVYHRLCGQDTDWVRRVTAWARDQSGKAVWPIVEAIDGADVYPVEEFTAACQAAVAGYTGAMMVFKLEGLLLDPARIESWKIL